MLVYPIVSMVSAHTKKAGQQARARRGAWPYRYWICLDIRTYKHISLEYIVHNACYGPVFSMFTVSYLTDRGVYIYKYVCMYVCMYDVRSMYVCMYVMVYVCNGICM